MDIKIIATIDSDGLESQTMEINSKERLSVKALCDFPEDAIIGRDLVSCKEVSSFMREAYEAGKRGEEFNVTVVVEEV